MRHYSDTFHLWVSDIHKGKISELLNHFSQAFCEMVVPNVLKTRFLTNKWWRTLYFLHKSSCDRRTHVPDDFCMSQAFVVEQLIRLWLKRFILKWQNSGNAANIVRLRLTLDTRLHTRKLKLQMETFSHDFTNFTSTLKNTIWNMSFCALEACRFEKSRADAADFSKYLHFSPL